MQTMTAEKSVFCPHCGEEYAPEEAPMSVSGHYCTACIREALDSYATELAFVRDEARQVDVVESGLVVHNIVRDEDARRVFGVLAEADPDLLREWVEDYVTGRGRSDYLTYLMETR